MIKLGAVEILKEKLRNDKKLELGYCQLLLDRYTMRVFGEKSDLTNWQKEFVIDKSRRIAAVCGRQCIASDEYVYMKDGIKRVSDVKCGDIQIDGSIVSDIHSFYDDGYNITLWNGIKIKVSRDHRFMTRRGWIRADELTNNDYIQFVSADKFTNKTEINTDKYLNQIYDDLESVYDAQYKLWLVGITSIVYKSDNKYKLKLVEYEPYVKVKNIEHYYGEFIGWNATPTHQIISYCGMVNHNCGKTTVCAIKAIMRAWIYENSVIMIISKSLRQAKEFFSRLKAMILYDELIKDDVESMTIEKVRFKNGSEIFLIPQNEDSVRGYTGDMVIIDEAQDIDDKVFMAVAPALAVKSGQMIAIGTPKSCNGMFYQLWKNPNISKYHATSYSNPNADTEQIEEFKATHSDIDVKREIYAEFTDDNGDGVLFNIDLINRCSNIMTIEEPEPTRYRYFMGIDVASKNDDFAVCVLAVPIELETLEEGCVKQVRQYKWSKQSLPYSANKVNTIIHKWCPEVIAIDSNGIGLHLYQQLKDEYSNVIGINFSGVKRTNLYMSARELMEKGFVRLLDKEEIKESLKTYTVKETADNIVRIIKQNKDAVDDIGDSIVYSLYSVKQFYGYGSIKVEMLDIEFDALFNI